MGQESFYVVRFHLGPLLQGQTQIAKLKSAYISLIVCPRGSGVNGKLVYRISFRLGRIDEIRKEYLSTGY